jgi:hypothetical protein
MNLFNFVLEQAAVFLKERDGEMGEEFKVCVQSAEWRRG